ncbi:MAG: hypothetical protein COW24_04530 [Candidatus Kerfeldbacteria bacterium CG15_BIG_FIL_POST_REV_8_21_14_020_45_12]|uniref:Uncharacterized protein n=1 Tax=Candidatus Kerfeldbacteria bacterium CG15_BIG_FIL_POST_REV_8_21_14_020_45_12 TaxID=2014247 RepID=A0A2M7H2Y5_9BACT|nr:MAG: hypothetical protein COW24_04530 [Candidatus Kerfeldbacteria bacterium CG15_BIG_FIL_POST_REV_8_21_14_020_45_12]PJA93358.1 MAG: hypothetical protein CO132_03305 [Candidatus Kerfeldbacteria bacterium CG_4_9_14_3_um_filter_45_8]
MHYDYFIVARYRNKEQAIDLADRLRAAKKTVYCFAESEPSAQHVAVLDDDTEAAMAAFESIENWREDPRVRDIFETDMEALRASDAVVVLMPVGKSGHIESGVAYGLGKQTIMIGEQVETESLYLIFDQEFSTVDLFIESIGSGLIG